MLDIEYHEPEVLGYNAFPSLDQHTLQFLPSTSGATSYCRLRGGPNNIKERDRQTDGETKKKCK